MQNRIKKLPQAHLVNIINSTKDHHPNFVLMLGAGASATSKVKLAKDMIIDWRDKCYDMYKNDGQSFEEYFNSCSWYKLPEEYSILFEKLYDQPSQRREYIESCIKDASPSWGYIYLVNLLRNKVFNTIFTTNFDDLLNEACYLFSSEVRPIVCAHDSSISSVRITSQRPKIIKLHGDFLFDNIKNTMRELETLEQNTKDKFKQYATEFGFIVLGYAGNDRSIIDTFNTLLKFDQYFPNGIYWCVRKGTEVSDNVASLARFPKFKIVEIEGFDEFSADLHSSLGYPLQPEMSEPYTALVKKLNGLTGDIKSIVKGRIHPVIEKDISALGREISRFDDSSSSKDDNLPIPYGLLSDIQTQNQKFDLALQYRMKELELTPTPNAFIKAVELMIRSNKFDCEDDLLDKLQNSKDLFASEPSDTFDIAIPYINASKYAEANTVLDFGYEVYKQYNGKFTVDHYLLNKFQILKHNNQPFNDEQLNQLELIEKSNNEITKMGAQILLDKFSEVESFLVSFGSRHDISIMKNWPIIKFLNNKITDQSVKKSLELS